MAGAVGMALGIRKCAVAHMRGGAVKRHVGEIRVAGGEVQEVEVGDPYRYLRVHQVMRVHAKVTKMRIRTEYLRRVRLVWNSALNAGEKVRAHNVWAVAVLRYYFAVTEWHPSDLLELDRATRGTLTQSQAHSLGATPEWLYLPRAKGGRGIKGVALTFEMETVNAALYLSTADDVQVRGAVRCMEWVVEEHLLPTTMSKGRDILEHYGISASVLDPGFQDPDGRPIGRIQKAVKAELVRAQQGELLSQVMAKIQHGTYPRQLTEDGIDRAASVKWLVDGKVPARVEAMVFEAQDNATRTRAREGRIFKTRDDQSCRACHEREETVGHILAGCVFHLFRGIKKRHDRALYVLVREILLGLGVPLPATYRYPWGQAEARTFGTGSVTVVVDTVIQTRGRVMEYRPDVVVYQHAAKCIEIFEVACAYEPCLLEREIEKRRKYLPLATDLARQFEGYRTRVTPVVMGDLGTVGRLRTHLTESGVFWQDQVDRVVCGIQREVLCGSVDLLTKHLLL